MTARQLDRVERRSLLARKVDGDEKERPENSSNPRI